MAGKIFINYRRGDDPGHTGRLFDRLHDAFRPEQLFMDVDSIKPGLDFVRVLEEQVSQCDIVLAVIGRNWIDARGADGARRLDNPDDFVRIEIESALAQNKLVIPVLVGEAAMPRPEELPDTIKALARRNAVRLTHERFRTDAQGLIKALEDALENAEAARRVQAEAVARKRADERREAEERARQDRAPVPLTARSDLSAAEVAKIEELAHWDFIKESLRPQDFRDHLARYPGGVCEGMARRRLGTIEEDAYRKAIGKTRLEAFLQDFPNSRHADDAWRRLAIVAPQSAARPAASLAQAAGRALFAGNPSVRRRRLIGAGALLLIVLAAYALFPGLYVGSRVEPAKFVDSEGQSKDVSFTFCRYFFPPGRYRRVIYEVQAVANESCPLLAGFDPRAFDKSWDDLLSRLRRELRTP